MKRTLTVVLSIILIALLCVTPVSATEWWEADFYYGAGAPYTLNYPSKDEIIAKIQELDIDLSFKDQYAEDYSLDSSGYAPGRLTDETEQKSLNLLNLYRFVAGLPDDVELKNEYIQLAQAGMLADAANNMLTHYPARPAGMSNELYELCSQGASESNIAWNHGNLAASLQGGWMDDSDKNNIDRMGHRRWVLNPSMKYTGFGAVGAFTAMYSFDKSRNGQFAGDYVAWPAPNTPLEMFSGSVFSFSLGIDYDDPVAKNITVEVSSETLGKSWTVSSSNPEQGFYVDMGGYGINKCLIFKVADFMENDTVTVHIDGLTKNGQAAPIDYTVNLFSLTDIKTDRTTIMTTPRMGADLNVTAVSLFSKEAPAIRWNIADENVAGIYRYGRDSHLIYYGEGEGRTTITLYTAGASVDVDVIVKKNSKFLLGDADGDGDVNISDATTIQRYLAGLDVAEFCDYLCDIDADKDINIADATAIQRVMAGIQTPFKVGVSQTSPFTF